MAFQALYVVLALGFALAVSANVQNGVSFQHGLVIGDGDALYSACNATVTGAVRLFNDNLRLCGNDGEWHDISSVSSGSASAISAALRDEIFCFGHGTLTPDDSSGVSIGSATCSCHGDYSNGFFDGNMCHRCTVGYDEPTCLSFTWFPFASQAGANSYKDFPLPGSTRPERLVVQVRATDGVNSGYVFEGTGSAHRDDDSGDANGGIIFGYKAGWVRMWAPDANNANNDGYLVAVPSLWGAGTFTQLSHSAEVRVVVGSESWPAPDYSTTQLMTAQAGAGSFVELTHGLGVLPERVEVLVESPNTGFFFPAQGSGMNDDDGTHNCGGLVYGYSATAIRMWAPDKNNGNSGCGVGSIADGYGGEVNTEAFSSADVHIRMWANDIATPFFESPWTTMQWGQTTIFQEFAHNLNALPSRVSVEVRADEGNNNGFVFVAMGNAQRNSGSVNVGGVLFAYNENNVRVWGFNGGDGGIIAVTDGWGGEVNGGTVRTGAIRVRVWA